VNTLLHIADTSVLKYQKKQIIYFLKIVEYTTDLVSTAELFCLNQLPQMIEPSSRFSALFVYFKYNNVLEFVTPNYVLFPMSSTKFYFRFQIFVMNLHFDDLHISVYL
jgi:hypothetical protein